MLSFAQNVLSNVRNSVKGGSEDNDDSSSQGEDKTILDPADNEWSVAALMERVPDLSVVVDLTNTNKYYHRKALTKLKADIQYNKIYTEGHVVPNRKVVKE